MTWAHLHCDRQSLPPRVRTSRVAGRRGVRRGGLTLLELIIASSMLAVVMTTVSVVLRTARQAWEAHEADYARLEAAHATLRHIVRQVRQATDIVAISPSTDNSGQLSARLPDGTLPTWDHDGTTNVVMYGNGTADNLLATEISGLRLTSYSADGVTPTSVPGLIRALQVEVSVQLPVESGGARTIRSWVWLRSW